MTPLVIWGLIVQQQEGKSGSKGVKNYDRDGGGRGERGEEKEVNKRKR